MSDTPRPQTANATPVQRRPFLTDAVRLTGQNRLDITRYPGRLIAIEGTDGTGRSTQIALLREWLETQGYGVMHTALTRSRLAGSGLRKAKQGTTLGPLTLDLFYATDFADRLENDILPALRAGFVVLSDRYVYSVMARSIVRGMDRQWLEDLYRFAPIPHGVLYLKIDIDHLIPRVLSRGGFDYWESGLDFQEEPDVYRSWFRYQTRLLDAYDHLSQHFGFTNIDANRSIADVFGDLRVGTLHLLDGLRSVNP